MKRQHSGSALFLLELIIALLFFSLASAVCVQMFVKADTLSVRTVDTSKAVLLAQEKAEEFYAGEGVLSDTKEYFDRNWIQTDSESKAVYQLDASVSRKGSAADSTSGSSAADSASSGNDPVCSITVQKISDGSTLFSLEVLYHQRREAS
jgi:Tfp pilus assembly protein PilV